MRITDSTMEELLTDVKHTSADELSKLKEEANHSKHSLQDVVLAKGIFDEINLTKLYADTAHIPFVEIDPRDVPTEVLNKIPERIARQYNAVLFQIDEDGTMHLAMDDPDDVQAVNFIEKQIGANTKLYVATRDNILSCLANKNIIQNIFKTK